MMISGSSEHFLEEDAAHLVDVYRAVYNEVASELARPNVLITGITGSGKSSFINAIFGESLAKVGEGHAITQHFTRHHPKNKPIVLYDSKGLENGKAREFIDSTRAFFGQHQKDASGDISHCIHVVWYIVNSAMARFQEFEKLICSELFHDVPIIFILNKKDISTDEQREAIRAEIRSMELSNCFGIIDTDASHKTSTIDFDCCPKCGDEDIVIIKKKKILMCQSCGHSQSIVRKNGLADVIDTTIDVLPLLAKESFISAQGVAFHLKEERSKRIINEFHETFEKNVRHKKSLMSVTARCLTRLSMLWDFREHGNLYGVDMAKHMVSMFGFRDEMMLLLHKDHHQHYLALALIVLWNRCLRNLAKVVFERTARIADGKVLDLGLDWKKIIHESFKCLKHADLLDFEKVIEKSSLTEILEGDMPTVSTQIDKNSILTSKCLASIEATEGSFDFSKQQKRRSAEAYRFPKSGSEPKNLNHLDGGNEWNVSKKEKKKKKRDKKKKNSLKKTKSNGSVKKTPPGSDSKSSSDSGDDVIHHRRSVPASMHKSRSKDKHVYGKKTKKPKARQKSQSDVNLPDRRSSASSGSRSKRGLHRGAR